MDPYDPLQTCPYDEAHRVIKSGMQRHLVKCRKNYPKKEMLTCMYNATHLINPMEYDYHIENCEDAREVISFTHVLSNPNTINAIPIQTIQDQFIPESENWDADPDVPSYDPTAHVENSAILRTLSCAPKSQKKKFRAQERLRFQELEAKKIDETHTGTKSNTSGPKKSTSMKDTDFAFSNLTLSDLTNTATNPAEIGKNKKQMENASLKQQPLTSRSDGPVPNGKLKKEAKPTMTNQSWSGLFNKKPSNAPVFQLNALGRGSRLQPSFYKDLPQADCSPEFVSRPGRNQFGTKPEELKKNSAYRDFSNFDSDSDKE